MARRHAPSLPPIMRKISALLPAFLALSTMLSTAADKWAPFLASIERESGDERGYVKKAVNWALRNIGKRDADLHAQAIACAQRIAATGSKAGRWIAADALKELEGEAVQRRVGG